MLERVERRTAVFEQQWEKAQVSGMSVSCKDAALSRHSCKQQIRDAPSSQASLEVRADKGRLGGFIPLQIALLRG